MFFIKKKQFYINGTQNLAETRGHFDGLFFSSFFLSVSFFWMLSRWHVQKKLVKQEHVTSQSCNRKFLAGI